MGYFKELPNIQTINRTKNDVSIDETVIIKNFFRRAKIREDIINVVTAFEYYEITENETPSQVAEKIYGESELDWVVLTTNNIINVQDDWPIDSNSFNNYLIDKYGSEDALTEIHHYETLELKDSSGRVVLPEGLLVDQSFYDAPEFRSFDTPPPGIVFPPIIVPGTTASANAVLGNETTSVVGITNLQPGLGYKSPPSVTFSAPPVTGNASVNASINNFSVTSFNTLTGGQGYTTTPTVTISPPPDSVQSTALCEIDSPNGSVIEITQLNGGSGYGLTAPTVTFSGPPILIKGSYSNQSSISAGSAIDGMFVREDGLRLFTTNGVGSGLVKEFSMSTGWDVTTLSFSQQLDVSADFSYCTGIEFKPDGTRMFISGGLGGSFRLISYDLSTPWNISTAVKVHQISTPSPGGIRISTNGLKLFFLETSSPDELKQYTLGTPWNITTLGNINSPQQIINLQELTGESVTLGFSFLSDGSKLFTTGEINSKVYEFSLTNSFDIQEVFFINDFYVGDKVSDPSDIFVKSDKSMFFICGGTEDKIFEYEMVSLAKGVATLTNGTVTNIDITQPGVGYTVAPTITISAPFPSVQATATAIMVSDTVVTKTWSVINNDSQSYLFTGTSSGSNINIIATVGDTLVFNVNANGHPFWIKTSQTVGTGNSVTTGTITNNGVTGNVGVVIPITWNTAGVTPGTYYYVCQNHISMSGTITINAPEKAFVSSINLTNGGFGYVFNPSVTITPAPTYRTAVGFAVLNQTTGISTVAIVDGGANYSSPPTITFGTPDEIQMVFPGDTYSQNNNTWRWNGTEWQEKFTEEFQYLDPVSAMILKTRGNLICRPITNYEHENNLNEKKRSILILKPQYLSVIITDLKNIMTYDSESSSYISDNLKSSFNPKFTIT